jgi:hypothetical protein
VAAAGLGIKLRNQLNDVRFVLLQLKAAPTEGGNGTKTKGKQASKLNKTAALAACSVKNPFVL